jgi:hypothetical protein
MPGMVRLACDRLIEQGVSSVLAFLSYQTDEKTIAGKVASLLGSLGVETFTADDDIEVSFEWRGELLKKIAAADLFVPILSAHYYQSIWCIQELGIAAFREMTVILLSLDGSVPKGFMAHIQSTNVDPANIRFEDLIPGLAKHDLQFAISALLDNLRLSRSFRQAEYNFGLLNPYLIHFTNDNMRDLLTISAENNQICNAGECIRTYLPPLTKSHGKYLKPQLRKKLKDTLANYGVRLTYQKQ